MIVVQIGDIVYVTEVYEEEDKTSSWWKTNKRAYLLSSTACTARIVEIDPNDNTSIRYKIGTMIHIGDIGFNCFLSKQEAEERVNGLNQYFKDNHCFAEE
jgi:hypothetical protein